MDVAYSCLKYFHHLYKFVNNNVRTHGHKNLVFITNLARVELVKDAICFFGKLYKWLAMLSESTIGHKSKYHNDVKLVALTVLGC